MRRNCTNLVDWRNTKRIEYGLIYSCGKSAGVAPPLFAELNELFKGKLPSDGNLKHSLITKGFSPRAAADVITVYKANVALVTGEKGDYSEREDEETPPMNPAAQIQTPLKPPAPPIPGVQNYAFALSPDARAELVLRGSLTVEDFEMLRDHIELTIKALTRKAKDTQQ